MKALKNIATSLIVTAIAASPAFAGQEASNSGLLTWLFLGFIGLIVVGQLIPALVMGFGMVKGVFGSSEDHAHNHNA
nr:hypothetical protein [uncultured Desulfuromonas sp.]